VPFRLVDVDQFVVTLEVVLALEECQMLLGGGDKFGRRRFAARVLRGLPAAEECSPTHLSLGGT
jgi:hypothetical protein